MRRRASRASSQTTTIAPAGSFKRSRESGLGAVPGLSLEGDDEAAAGWAAALPDSPRAGGALRVSVVRGVSAIPVAAASTRTIISGHSLERDNAIREPMSDPEPQGERFASCSGSARRRAFGVGRPRKGSIITQAPRITGAKPLYLPAQPNFCSSPKQSVTVLSRRGSGP
jgi:hypothetical protein